MVENKAENRFDKLTPTEIAIAGASSGFLTRALIQPFDVIKIRFQLQVEPINPGANSKYISMLQAVSLIYKEEGITAFWKGHVPAQILSISFGLMQFWCFEALIKQAKQAQLYNNKIIVNFTCGALAGTVATIASFPFDIMRTRLIAQNHEERVYRGLLSGYTHMLRNEGFSGLYKGITPTIISVAPNVGLQFMFYRLFDTMYRHLIFVDSSSYNVVGSLFAGSLAGLCSKTVIYPLDLTRKRMQIQGFQKYRRKFGADFNCSNMSDCIVKIYEVEGSSGLFKGMTPSIVKALVSRALSTLTVFPFDIIKTHLVAQGNQHRLVQGPLSGLAFIVRQEGFSGLYKGLTPALIATVPNAGSQFMFYLLFKRMYKRIVLVPHDSYNLLGSLVSGSMAGLCSKVLLYPFDLTRRRMQMQGLQEHRMSFGAIFVCSGMVHCITKIYLTEGCTGLYKGIMPSMAKAIFASGINFTTFETICRMISEG